MAEEQRSNERRQHKKFGKNALYYAARPHLQNAGSRPARQTTQGRQQQQQQVGFGFHFVAPQFVPVPAPYVWATYGYVPQAPGNIIHHGPATVDPLAAVVNMQQAAAQNGITTAPSSTPSCPQAIPEARQEAAVSPPETPRSTVHRDSSYPPLQPRAMSQPRLIVVQTLENATAEGESWSSIVDAADSDEHFFREHHRAVRDLVDIPSPSPSTKVSTTRVVVMLQEMARAERAENERTARMVENFPPPPPPPPPSPELSRVSEPQPRRRAERRLTPWNWGVFDSMVLELYQWPEIEEE